jgi:hypothetical protein
VGIAAREDGLLELKLQLRSVTSTLHAGELIAQTFIGGLRIAELLGECKKLRGLEGAEGALIIPGFENRRVKGLGQLVNERGSIHAWVPV